MARRHFQGNFPGTFLLLTSPIFEKRKPVFQERTKNMISKHNRSSKPIGAGYFIAAAIGILAFAETAPAEGMKPGRHFHQPGNLLIADQFNNRVIETDPAGKIVWQFGRGPADFSANSIIGVNDAERVGPFTLMAGARTPAGLIPEAPGGAVDNRVILVDPFGRIVWQYGQFGQTGSGFDLLNTPVQSTWLPNGDVFITDQGNARIIEVNLIDRKSTR